MHSYSQFVLLSWGYTTEPPENYMEFVSVLKFSLSFPDSNLFVQYPAAYEGAAALTAVHGTEYTVR